MPFLIAVDWTMNDCADHDDDELDSRLDEPERGQLSYFLLSTFAGHASSTHLVNSTESRLQSFSMVHGMLGDGTVIHKLLCTTPSPNRPNRHPPGFPPWLVLAPSHAPHAK